MRYNANSFERKCIKSECQCKGCPFNGIEKMCLGCSECMEHKMLAPVSNCTIIKKGNWSGLCAAALHDKYLISIPMGIADIPEYFHISKEEFDTFDEWQDDNSKLIEIQRRES